MASFFGIGKKEEVKKEAVASTTTPAAPGGSGGGGGGGGGAVSIRIFMPDDTSEQIAVEPDTTVAQALERTIRKFLTGSQYNEVVAKYTYALYEVNKGKDAKLLEPDANIFQRWTKKVKGKDARVCKFLFRSPNDDPMPRDAVSTALAFESPYSKVVRLLREALRNDVTTKNSRVQEELKHVLHIITTTANIYEASLGNLANIDNQALDKVAKNWLLNEFGGGRGGGANDAKRERTGTIGKNDKLSKAAKKHAKDAAADDTPPPGAMPLPPNSQAQGKDRLVNWHFSVFEYKEMDLVMLAMSMLSQHNLIQTFKIPPKKLLNFLNAVVKGYHDNPYHNFFHAFDVTQTLNCLLSMKGSSYLSRMDIFALIIGALCHDIDHPGKNNGFQVAAGTQYALTYNDAAVLENHHCAFTFKLLSEEDNNILDGLTKDEWKEFRKTFIRSVLMTDMANHFRFHSQFQQRLKGKPFESGNEDDRATVATLLLKCADISNIAKPWPYAKEWGDRVTEEMFAQGDAERAFGIPVVDFMDRTKSTQAKNTANFIDFVAKPIFESLTQFLPETKFLMDHIQENRNNWDEIIRREKIVAAERAAAAAAEAGGGGGGGGDTAAIATDTAATDSNDTAAASAGGGGGGGGDAEKKDDGTTPAAAAAAAAAADHKKDGSADDDGGGGDSKDD